MNKKAKTVLLALIIAAIILGLVIVPYALAGKGKKIDKKKSDERKNDAPKPECRDGIDNDGDGFKDYKWDKKRNINKGDQGCTSKNDNDETNCGDGVCEGGETAGICPADCFVAECNDGIDNSDTDALADYPNDPGCTDAFDTSEIDGDCDDGLDNDGDTFIDTKDPGCTGTTDPSELGAAQCDDGVDNDGDSYTDYPDDPDCNSPTDNDESAPLKPDMVISYINFIEYVSNASAGNASNSSGQVFVETQFSVKNLAAVPSGTSNAKEQTLSTRYVFVPSLTGPSDVAVYTNNYQCTSPHTFEATADIFNEINESDEGNNVASVYIDCIV